jgi:hypothetical protein
MRKKNLLLTNCMAFLMLYSGSSWGQHGVLLPEKQGQPEIKPRRGDAPGIGYITTPGNINNEFGAGESAKVDGGSITWPVSHTLNLPALQLGSEYSKNIVIESYNAIWYRFWLDEPSRR